MEIRKQISSEYSSIEQEEQKPKLSEGKLHEQTYDKVNDIVIKSNTSYTDTMGDMHIVGEVQNNLPTMAESVKIVGKKITIVAACATAMSLDIKNSTRYIDFTGPEQDTDEFKIAVQLIPSGFIVDC